MICLKAQIKSCQVSWQNNFIVFLVSSTFTKKEIYKPFIKQIKTKEYISTAYKNFNHIYKTFIQAFSVVYQSLVNDFTSLMGKLGNAKIRFFRLQFKTS